MDSGASMFVRYAFPPNQRGYCGPSDTGALLGYGRAGARETEFRPVAQAFTGAWPYLELIAAAAGIADPLDARVVEATGSGTNCSIRSARPRSVARWRICSGAAWGSSASWLSVA